MSKISVPKENKQTASSSSDKPRDAQLASLAHWAFLISFVIPFTSIIIPLVLYCTTGKQDPFVKENAKEALNLFICSTIYGILFGILCIVLIGIPLLILLVFYLLIFPIIAAIQTMGSTEDTPLYRYPCIFRLIQ